MARVTGPVEGEDDAQARSFAQALALALALAITGIIVAAFRKGIIA
ncbi:MAG: hypothetical protein LBJ86_04350 [Spirochaetaceae bacterium]|nr:hypothetical protein [Spirochaetaceae bacterium]